jgi:hypothetical protein
MLESLVLAAALFTGPTESNPTPPQVVATKSDPNQTGKQISAYRGKYFAPSMEPFRQCVAQREGRHQYWGTGSNGLYQGTYQMTAALVRGAAWMMAPELKRLYGPQRGREIRDTLLSTPGSKWSRYYSDMSFWTILNWEGQGSGAHHWRGGRYGCTTTMKDWGGSK